MTTKNLEEMLAELSTAMFENVKAQAALRTSIKMLEQQILAAIDDVYARLRQVHTLTEREAFMADARHEEIVDMQLELFAPAIMHAQHARQHESVASDPDGVLDAMERALNTPAKGSA
jgi:hypothetical protein